MFIHPPFWGGLEPQVAILFTFNKTFFVRRSGIDRLEELAWGRTAPAHRSSFLSPGGSLGAAPVRLSMDTDVAVCQGAAMLALQQVLPLPWFPPVVARCPFGTTTHTHTHTSTPLCT